MALSAFTGSAYWSSTSAYTSVNCFKLSLTSESPVIDDCWPDRWANRIPRKPQASKKKTTRKSDRRELRAILYFLRRGLPSTPATVLNYNSIPPPQNGPDLESHR